MKKLILLLIVIISTSGCVIMPSRLNPYERRLWIHQNYPKQYHYKQYPNLQERTRRGRIYIPYFRPGRY